MYNNKKSFKFVIEIFRPFILNKIQADLNQPKTPKI
jgi:hypothetical protein